MERGGHVRFELELCLCPSDLNRAKFMKDEGNKIVAIDFGGYSFLPPSLFAFVLNQGDHSGFTQRIARKFVHSPSSELAALVNASCALVPFSSNNIGEQISLLSFLFPASLALREYRTQCAAQVFRRSSGPGFSTLDKHGAQPVPRSTRLRPPFSLLLTGALSRIVGSPKGRH